MTKSKPVVVALPLDHQTDELLATVQNLGQRLKCPFVVVHALGKRRLESEASTASRIAKAKQTLDLRLQPLRQAGLEVQDEVAVGDPAELVINTALRITPQLIITGGGRPATIRRWLVGSAVEEIVHRALVPVWVVREDRTVRVRRPVLCPINLNSPSKLGLASAVRMARLFEAPLRVMTVLPESSSGEDPSVEASRQQLQDMIAQEDVSGLDVKVEVVVGEAGREDRRRCGRRRNARDRQSGLRPLIPELLNPITTRALRHSQCSILAVREVHVDLQASEAELARLADACHKTWELIGDNRAAEALPFIEPVAQLAPYNAKIQEAYAIVLEKLGQDVEARARHELSKMIRTRIDRG